MFIFAWYAEKLDIAAVTGAYFAGVFIGRLKQKHQIDEQITIDDQNGTVKYGNNILARTPGNDSNTRTNIIKAYKELLESNEYTSMKKSYNQMAEKATAAQIAPRYHRKNEGEIPGGLGENYGPRIRNMNRREQPNETDYLFY